MDNRPQIHRNKRKSTENRLQNPSGGPWAHLGTPLVRPGVLPRGFGSEIRLEVPPPGDSILEPFLDLESHLAYISSVLRCPLGDLRDDRPSGRQNSRTRTAQCAETTIKTMVFERFHRYENISFGMPWAPIVWPFGKSLERFVLYFLRSKGDSKKGWKKGSAANPDKGGPPALRTTSHTALGTYRPTGDWRHSPRASRARWRIY